MPVVTVSMSGALAAAAERIREKMEELANKGK